MALSEEDRIIYQQRLDDARSAYNDLVQGKAVKRFVDQNGETIEYTAANADRLWQYIAWLEGQLTPALARCRQPRPLGFLF